MTIRALKNRAPKGRHTKSECKITKKCANNLTSKAIIYVFARFFELFRFFIEESGHYCAVFALLHFPVNDISLQFAISNFGKKQKG